MKQGRIALWATMLFLLTACQSREPLRRAPDLEARLRKYRLEKDADETADTPIDGIRTVSSLEWLAATQASDGSWPVRSLRGHSNALSTSLAAMAFLWAGYGTPEIPDTNKRQFVTYRTALKKALDYLVKVQDASGAFEDVENLNRDALGLGRSAVNLSTAIAALVFAESAKIDTAYRKAAERAVGFLLSTQEDEGGWDIGPPPPAQEGIDPVKPCSDAYVTSWVVIALKIAGHQGISVDAQAALARARLFLNRVAVIQSSQTGEQLPVVFGTLRYDPLTQSESPGIRDQYGSTELLATAALARFYLGDTIENAFLRMARDALLSSDISQSSANLLFFGNLAVCVLDWTDREATLRDFCDQSFASLRKEYYTDGVFTPTIKSKTDRAFGLAGVAALVTLAENALVQQLGSKGK